MQRETLARCGGIWPPNLDSHRFLLNEVQVHTTSSIQAPRVNTPMSHQPPPALCLRGTNICFWQNKREARSNIQTIVVIHSQRMETIVVIHAAVVSKEAPATSIASPL